MGKTRKITTEALRRMKADGRKITALTAYDHLFASLLDDAGIDLILVGDSVATVVQGEDTTVPVTLDQMIYHAGLVSRGVRRAFVVGDMPFLTYRVSTEEALHNAGRLMQTARVEAVKIEGGQPVLDCVRRLTDAGIPVMGHLGLTPQSIHKFGTYRVRGEESSEAEQILEDARCLEQAGAFGVVLEKIPTAVAASVTRELTIPTIGIGAGPECDGQILVSYDMLGLFTRFHPRFVRRYRELAAEIRGAVESYCADVRDGDFPNADESY
ncbi:MAG: 3-methyl-2-oxobutanoate hydroxymethyltransferase [Planctomycetes bacterium]|nr:3-methyl-2-oxobutanoate hydroxymethyltransferase [Planctomycetota bacterium]